MPKGPKGEKRKADVIGNAVLVMRIATGQVSEDAVDEKKRGAVEIGRKGGQKRAEATPSKRRSEIAKKAAKARWRSAHVPLRFSVQLEDHHAGGPRRALASSEVPLNLQAEPARVIAPQRKGPSVGLIA